jgi:hypothetical protein
MLGVTIVGWKQRDLAMERLAARFGPRLFMSLGPAIMALGLGWLARIPADSQAWVLVAASVDTSSHQFRTAVAPLNQPPEDVSPPAPRPPPSLSRGPPQATATGGPDRPRPIQLTSLGVSTWHHT